MMISGAEWQVRTISLQTHSGAGEGRSGECGRAAAGGGTWAAAGTARTRSTDNPPEPLPPVTCLLPAAAQVGEWETGSWKSDCFWERVGRAPELQEVGILGAFKERGRDLGLPPHSPSVHLTPGRHACTVVRVRGCRLCPQRGGAAAFYPCDRELYLGDITGVVPDSHDKANIAKNPIPRTFWFPSASKRDLKCPYAHTRSLLCNLRPAPVKNE